MESIKLEVIVENGIIRLASNNYNIGLTGISVSTLRKLDGQDKQKEEAKELASPE